jgi:Ca-activated chloride channel family protein
MRLPHEQRSDGLGASRFVTMAVVLGPILAAGEQQAPVFRSGVQTVPIYATVVDATNRLVPDLEQEHFEVFDSGKPATLTLFKKEVQPISVVVAVDTSGSMMPSLDFAKDGAEAFLLRLLPHDRARIANFDDRVRINPEFSSDRDTLVRYLRTEVRFGNGTALWDAVQLGLEALTHEQNRRVVLVLSDGDDTSSRASDGDVIAVAQQTDTMIYAIGLRNYYRGGPNGSFIWSRPDGGLRRLTQQTGGGYFELSKAAELNSTFTRVAEELHRQYVMGISPAVADGKLHQLDVRAKVPGLTVRARKSYLAPKR